MGFIGGLCQGSLTQEPLCQGSLTLIRSMSVRIVCILSAFGGLCVRKVCLWYVPPYISISCPCGALYGKKSPLFGGCDLNTGFPITFHAFGNFYIFCGDTGIAHMIYWH